MVEQDSSVADVPEAREDEERKGQYAEEELGCTDRERFMLELEFIQCLASPQYIHWLAQNQWLDDPDFLRYLKYLNYWRRPEYTKYLIYPHCLFFLEMLQSKDFRKAMAQDTVKEMVHRQQFYFWQHYRNNRANEAPGEDSAPAEGSPSRDRGQGREGSQPNGGGGGARRDAGEGGDGGKADGGTDDVMTEAG